MTLRTQHQKDIDDVVALLEEMLVKARQGEFIQLAVSAVYTNDPCSTYRQATMYISPTLLGGIDMLAHAIRKIMYERAEETE